MANQDAKAVEELYDENIVSIEVMGGANDEPQIGTGVDAISKNTRGGKALRQSTTSISRDHLPETATIILSYVIKWTSTWKANAAR